MMAAQLPYLVTPGLAPKILAKIQEARRPDRFTQDFLETKLGQSGGSARAIIPLLKRMGFLNSDGSPSNLYDRFRNAETQASAVAEGIRTAYSDLFDRNRYAGDLSKEKLKALMTEVTGAASDDRAIELTLSTFLKLKELADFDADPKSEALQERQSLAAIAVADPRLGTDRLASNSREVGLNLAYTINIVLPETTNPEVFNAIFGSIRENLLKS
jgi:hypothetical protein